MASNGTPLPKAPKPQEDKRSMFEKILEGGSLLGPSGGVYSPDPIKVSPTKLDQQYFDALEVQAWKMSRVARVPIAGALFLQGKKEQAKDILDAGASYVYYPDNFVEDLRKKGFDVSGLPVEPQGAEAFGRALLHAPSTVGGGVRDVASNFLELFKPTAEAAFDVPFGSDGGFKERVQKLWGATGALVYALSLKPIVDNFDKTRLDPTNPHSKVNVGQGILNNIEDILPLKEFLSLSIGRNLKTKEPLKPHEWGSLFITGLLKAMFLKQAGGSLKEAFMANVEKPPIRVPVSKAEMDKQLMAAEAVSKGAKAGSKVGAEAELGEQLVPAEVGGKTLDEGIKETVNLDTPVDVSKLSEEAQKVITKVEDVTGEIPTIGDLAKVFSDAGKDPAEIPGLTSGQMYKVLQESTDNLAKMSVEEPDKFQSVLFDTAMRGMKRDKLAQAAGKGAGTLKMNVFADLIRSGVFGPDAIMNIFRTKVLDEGMSPEAVAKSTSVAATTIAKMLETGGREGGMQLQALSQSTLEGLMEIVKGNPEAVEGLSTLKEALRKNYKYMGPFQKAKYFFQKYGLKWMRGGATSAPATFERNIKSQGMIAALDTWEDFLVDSRVWAHSMKNVVLRGGKMMSPSEAFHQTMFDVVNTYQHLHAYTMKGYGAAKYVMERLGKKTGEHTYEWYLKEPEAYKPIVNVYDKIMEALPEAEKEKLARTFSSEFAVGDVLQKAYWKEFGKKLKNLEMNPDIKKSTARVKQAATIMDVMVDLGSLGNMLQEQAFRKLAYMRAVEKFSRERGYRGAADFLDALSKGKADMRTTMIGGFKSAEDARLRLEKLKAEDVPNMARDATLSVAQSFKKRLKNPYVLGAKILEHQKSLENSWNAQIDEALKLLDSGVEPNEALGGLSDKLAKKLGGEVESDMTIHARAYEASMADTLAKTPPEYSLGGHIMKAYRDMPFLVAFNYFPRFLINMWSYINERLPLTKEFSRSRLGQEMDAIVSKGSDVGLSRRALDEWARHVDGVMMLGASKMLQGSSYAGPHYYQIWTGFKDKDGNKIYADQRPNQPFSTFMFLSKVFDLTAKGKPIGSELSPADISDALIGVRRLQDQPGFAFSDVLRQLAADDPTTFKRSLKRLIGQPISMPFTGLRGYMNFLSAIGAGDSYNTVRDTMDRELVGPILNDIAPQALPEQYDPYLGGVAKSESDPVISGHSVKLGQWFRHLTGESLQTVSPLESYITHLGISTGDFVGHYKSQEANSAVRQWLGWLLGQKDKKGETLNLRLTRVWRSAMKNIPDPMAKMMTKYYLLKPLRESAIEIATIKAPNTMKNEGVFGPSGKVPKEIKQLVQEWMHFTPPPTQVRLEK